MPVSCCVSSLTHLGGGCRQMLPHVLLLEQPSLQGVTKHQPTSGVAVCVHSCMCMPMPMRAARVVWVGNPSINPSINQSINPSINQSP